MTSVSYEHLINKAFNNLSDEIEACGLQHILMYEEIEDYIFESVMLDKAKQCFWIIDSKELVTFAYELTLIDEKQVEDYYMWKLLRVKQ